MMTCRIAWMVLMSAATLPGAGDSSHQDAAREKAEGFVSLFDGKTLDGWRALTESGKEVAPAQSAFSVRDGMIHCSGKGRDYWLARKEKYADCVLRLEYRLTKGCNSGVFLRAPGPDRPAFKGFEVQIIDDTGEEPSKHTSGAIYDVLTPMRNMSRPIGQWNEMEVVCRGSTVVVRLNGFKVIDADFAELTQPIGKFDFPYCRMPREGLIGVQNHGGELWFRNIRIKQLRE